MYGEWPEGTKMILRLSVVLLGKPGTGKSRAITWITMLLREITKRIWWYLKQNEMTNQFPTWEWFEKTDENDKKTGQIKSDWFLIWGNRIKKIFEEARIRNGAGIIVCDELLNKLGNIMQGGKQTAFQLISRLNSEKLEPMLFSDSRYNFKGCSKNHINLLGGMTYDGYSNLLLNNIQSGGGARLFFLKVCDWQMSLPIALGFKIKQFFPTFAKTNEHIIDSAVNYWIVNHINPKNHMSWQQNFFDQYWLDQNLIAPPFTSKDFFLQKYYLRNCKCDDHYANLNDSSSDGDDSTLQMPPLKKMRVMRKSINNQENVVNDKLNAKPIVQANSFKHDTRKPYAFFWKSECNERAIFEPDANDNPYGRIYAFSIQHPDSPSIEQMNATKFKWENDKLSYIPQPTSQEDMKYDDSGDSDDSDILVNDCEMLQGIKWKDMAAKEAFAHAHHWINQAKESSVYKHNGEILLNRGRQIILNLASVLQMITNVIDKGGILGKLEHAYEAPYIYAAFRYFQMLCDELCNDYNYIVKINMIQKKTIATTKFEEIRETTVTNFQPTLQQQIQIKMIESIKLGTTLISSEVREILLPSFRRRFKNFCVQEIYTSFDQLVIVGLAENIFDTDKKRRGRKKKVIKLRHLDDISQEAKVLAIRHLKSLRISIEKYEACFVIKSKMEERKDRNIEHELSSIQISVD